MNKERPLQSMAIVIVPCWTNFCSQKLKRRISAYTFTVDSDGPTNIVFKEMCTVDAASPKSIKHIKLATPMTILFVYVPIHSKVSLIAEDYISMKISLNYRIRHLTFSSTWAYFAHVWFNRELVLSFCRTNKVVYKLKHRLAKRACDRLTEDADFGKKNHLFWWGSFWSWRVCKQAKLSNLGHPKRVCLVRILFQKHNWSIFLRKWARGGRNSQWRSLSFHVESIFVHKNWRGWYWQHLVSTGWRYVPHSPSYTWWFAPCFWRSHY